MRKFLLAAVAALVAASALAVVALATNGPDGTSWTGKFIPDKPNRAAAIDALIQPSPKGADGKPTAATKVTILFTKGSAFNTSVPPLCTATSQQLTATKGAVCAKAQVGSGEAIARVGPNEVGSTIKAFNRKNAIQFYIQPCKPNTGPGTRVACSSLGNPIYLTGTLTKTTQGPKLTVIVPDTLSKLGVVITKFALKTKVITKRISGVLKSYVLSPTTCGGRTGSTGKWTTKTTINYKTRAAITITDTQICRKR